MDQLQETIDGYDDRLKDLENQPPGIPRHPYEPDPRPPRYLDPQGRSVSEKIDEMYDHYTANRP